MTYTPYYLCISICNGITLCVSNSYKEVMLLPIQNTQKVHTTFTFVGDFYFVKMPNKGKSNPYVVNLVLLIYIYIKIRSTACVYRIFLSWLFGNQTTKTEKYICCYHLFVMCIHKIYSNIKYLKGNQLHRKD